jgi:hypothetical protein
MNREDIIRMAQEAGFEGCAELTWESVICTEELEAFAKLVAQHEEKRLTDAAMKAIVVAIETAMALEREACANLCIELAPSNKTMTAYKVLHEASKAIQLRGQA